MHFPWSAPRAWIGIVWLLWLISWILAAFWRDRATARPPRQQELPYRLLNLLGILLMVILPRHAPLWRLPPVLGFVCLALQIGGVAFAWWARIHLGRLWSASVTGKSGHRIIDTGPYALVRHPIYTGLLLAVIVTAIAMGYLRGLIGAAVIVYAIVLKARLEERFLRDQLGLAAYDDYAARVPMLVPFGKGWG
jgi:protein-S-isoprenylcysteine O-methyltransferase Ste14